MEKLQEDSVIIRTVPMPSDINMNGHIFGGWVLSQMDMAGGNVAWRRAKGPVATVAIEGMTFHKPIMVGDVVSVYAKIVKVGRTSMTIDITVYAERRNLDDHVKVTEGCFIFVAVDENGKSRPLDPD